MAAFIDDPDANLRLTTGLLTFRQGNQMARISPHLIAYQTEANPMTKGGVAQLCEPNRDCADEMGNLCPEFP